MPTMEARSNGGVQLMGQNREGIKREESKGDRIEEVMNGVC